LGLAITKAIIARHKGKIEVMSKPGEGTIFNIFLPLNDKGRDKEI
jgi:signal transduction histidine kinase